jgi:exodeoxyribonuclease V gamma subunit
MGLSNLGEGLQCWLETCAGAGFDEPVPLAVLREAWMNELDAPTLNHQFVSGGVTFCTLMPMRAVPFRAVCLLGMNDGDFPRRARPSDFDLLALPGMARPGDRSRRDDDRYLMLEALLAARDKFYVSWVGRNVRDNSEQPPSVLVAQLRDYLKAGWDMDDLDHITTEHPLQPFSRRYFQRDGLLTYAGEWRTAHGADEHPVDDALPAYELESDFVLKLGELASFLRQPARFFFRRRLGVVFADAAHVGDDEEPFGLDALKRYQIEDHLLDDSGEAEAIGDVRATLAVRAERLAREGVLPIGLMGRMWQEQLVESLAPVRTEWLRLGARFPQAAPKFAVSLLLGDIHLDDWIDRLRSSGEGSAWLMQISSKVLDRAGNPRGDKLIAPWLRQLAAAAAGNPVTGYLVARDAVLEMAPLAQEAALETLRDLVRLWRANLDSPLPVACKTALSHLAQGDPRATYDGGFELRGEVDDLCLARLWPDFDALKNAGGWPDLAEELYGPLARWMQECVKIRPLQESAT